MVASTSKCNGIWHTALRYGGRRANGHCRRKPDDRDAPPIEYPILRSHSEAGRLSLYVEPAHRMDFNGVGEEAALDLLDEVYAKCSWQPSGVLPSLMGG